MFISLTMGLLATLVACEPNAPGYAGYDMVDHFPLDGSSREWIYSNDGADHKLFVEMAASTTVGDVDVKTLEYWQTDPSNNQPSTLLYSIDWVSDPIVGVQIHGYTWYSDPVEQGDTGDTGTSDTSGGEADSEPQSMTFDPPIQIASRRMVPGDSEVTETGGTTFTSTFESAPDCANDWVSGDNTWTCVHIILDDGDGDISTGIPVAGEFWSAPRYGLSWFQLTGDADKWVLAKAVWEE